MIRVEQLSDDVWKVAVAGLTTTEHLVRVTPQDLERFGGEGSNAEALLQASFKFLLERESNTSILREFDLPVIGRYFPEYEETISRDLP